MTLQVTDKQYGRLCFPGPRCGSRRACSELLTRCSML